MVRRFFHPLFYQVFAECLLIFRGAHRSFFSKITCFPEPSTSVRCLRFEFGCVRIWEPDQFSSRLFVFVRCKFVSVRSSHRVFRIG